MDAAAGAGAARPTGSTSQHPDRIRTSDGDPLASQRRAPYEEQRDPHQPPDRLAHGAAGDRRDGQRVAGAAN